MPACVHAQLCPTLCNPRDCSPLGSSVHGISQARMLEWVAIPFSRGSSWPSDRTQVSRAAGGFLYCRPTLYQLSQHSQGWKRGVLLNAREPEARGAASLCGRTHSQFRDTWQQLGPGAWVWGCRDSSGLSSPQPSDWRTVEPPLCWLQGHSIRTPAPREASILWETCNEIITQTGCPGRSDLAWEVREGSPRGKSYAGQGQERRGEHSRSGSCTAKSPRGSLGASQRGGGEDGCLCVDSRYSVHLSRIPHKWLEQSFHFMGNGMALWEAEPQLLKRNGKHLSMSRGKPVHQRC